MGWGGTAAIVQAKSMVVDRAGNLYAAGGYSGTVDFNPAGGALRKEQRLRDRAIDPDGFGPAPDESRQDYSSLSILIFPSLSITRQFV